MSNQKDGSLYQRSPNTQRSCSAKACFREGKGGEGRGREGKGGEGRGREGKGGEGRGREGKGGEGRGREGKGKKNVSSVGSAVGHLILAVTRYTERGRQMHA